jgi:hypothetical protein
MAKRKTKIIQLDNGREADAVEELRDVLRAAGAPIFINRNKLVWLFADGAVFPLTPQRLRFEAQQYMTFTKAGKLSRLTAL